MPVLRLLLLASLAVAAQADWQWSDHVDILGPTGQESIVAFPQVGVDPISGIATAAWIDTTTFMNEKVQAVRFTDGQWGTPEIISQNLEPVASGAGSTQVPVRGLAAQVAPGKNGNATVAWTSLLPDRYGLSGVQWKKAKARWSDPAFTPMENIVWVMPRKFASARIRTASPRRYGGVPHPMAPTSSSQPLLQRPLG